MRPTATAHAAVVLLAIGVFVASPVLAGSDFVAAEGAPTTYSAEVSAAATLAIDVEYDAAGSTTFRLDVTGLASVTAYAGRVHTGGCPADVAALGRVFQLVPAPAESSGKDPAFVNDVNEVWLDLVTDDAGSGEATSVHPWQFPPQDRPGALVLHEAVELTRPGGTTAGRPLACLEVTL
jgi:hypothetical protein